MPEKETLTPRQAAAMDLLEWYRAGKVVYRQRHQLSAQQDYALYRNLVSNTIRYRERFLFFIGALTGRSLKKLDHEVVICLMLGLVQLDLLSGVHDYAAVNETVNLMAFLKKPKLKGFINGNLRSFIRQKDDLVSRFEQQSLAIRTSHPQWMIQRWERQYGSKTTEKICHANNRTPEVRIVLNPAFDRQAIEADLDDQFKIVKQHKGGLTLQHPAGLFNTKWAAEGAFLVQDPSSQQINHLIDTLPKKRVLDACAAPGGKLFHMEWQFNNEIDTLVALDFSEERLTRLVSNWKTYHSRAMIVRMDATRPAFSSRFDLVLVDAPCSATGTIQKHPELKWQRREADLLQNQQKQLSILDGIKEVVQVNGHLLYVTCSMEKEENQNVIEAFLKKNSGTFQQVPFSPIQADQSLLTPEGFFQCLPGEETMGLFAGLLQKTADK